MPTGGFKILDTAEVKMAFSGYSMFMGNNELQAPPSSAASGSSWFASTFSSSSRPSVLASNDARSTDRTDYNVGHTCCVALVAPTQVCPSGPTSGAGVTATASSAAKPAAGPSTPLADNDAPKYDPEIITAARTHRALHAQSAIGEVYSLNGAMNAAAPPIAHCARIRDVETLVLAPPAVAIVALYNNTATLFGAVDPASPHPHAATEFQTKISESERLVPLQSVRFSVRCTAFTTFTTHVDFGASHGGSGYGGAAAASSSPTPPHAASCAGPFTPCELWSVFGFGSGDVVVWSHSQEAMLKRHNNTTALARDAEKRSAKGGGADVQAGAANMGAAFCCVEPGVAVSAIARVDRGSTEPPACMRWRQHHSNNQRTSVPPSSTSAPSPTAHPAPSGAPVFNTQTSFFCDLCVGYENGTILVVSVNATGGFVNQKLCGWFGFSAVRTIRACPIAPHLLAVGCDDGSLRFLHFPWSFDVGYFEARFKSAACAHLTVSDLGTARDPRVLCNVGSAVSGGSVTCASWSYSGEAVVCTGDDDSVSIVSIECLPALVAPGGAGGLAKHSSWAQRSSQSSGSDPSLASSSAPHRQATANNNATTTAHRAVCETEPLSVCAVTIHRRTFHKSWITGNMVLSLDVVNTDPVTDLPETRKVTAVYTASLDGAVVAGAAFPVSELSLPRRVATGGSRSAVMERHSSIVPGMAGSGGTTPTGGGGGGTISSSKAPGLGIRQRPLARFLQMARLDTVLNFAPIGEHRPDTCPCLQAADASASVPPALPLPQRKRSFVTVTANGTVAMWLFYDILTEPEADDDV